MPRLLIALLCLGAASLAQQKPAEPAPEPKVQLNVMNVCAPPDADRKEISAALARVPAKPAFAVDFEVARGRSSMPGEPLARWVRIRREFSQGSFSNVQYTFNADEKAIAEMLVFRVRDPQPGEALQFSISDSVTAGTPEMVLSSDTPAARLKLERYGKASVGLSRCPGEDQTAYEPMLRRASEILAQYRVALRVRQTVPGDLARLTAFGAGPSKVRKQAAPESDRAPK